MKQMVSVFLSKTKVKAIRAWLKNDQISKSEVLEEQLNDELDLYKFLLTVKKQFKTDEVKLLIDQSALFIDLLTWPVTEKLNEAKLLEKIKSLIPANLDGDLIKWSERGQIEDESGLKKLIQFLVIDKDFWAKVQADFKKANIEIESFEPVFASLLRLTSNNEEPHLIRVNEHRLIVFHGVMYASARIIPGNDEKEEEQSLINYAEEHWGLKVKKIVNANLDQLILNCFLQEDLCCQDDKVEEEKKKSSWWLVALIFLIILIISSVIFWQQLWELMSPYFQTGDEGVQEEQMLESEPSVEASPVEELEVEEILIEESLTDEAGTLSSSLIRSELKIQILNGSGISGLAGQLEDLLLSMDYEDDLIEVGNADNVDYQTSVLIVLAEKAEIADLLYDDLQVKMDLEVKVDDIINNTNLNDFDAIIILGKGGESINEKN
jgi:hypothetical protein